ncbi:MAG: exodeoxyribonuclease VII large subunit [Proteobacteria bacterium]|nr:exodeoxyribonuclease VII large subunit [Pseudomonadota bacterium]
MKADALTVSELTQDIKQLLELNYGRICVLGEVSNLARPSSGHVYFNLKDDNSQIAAVMFRSSVQRSRFQLENGQEFLAFGRITVYEPRGTYQIIVDRVEPFGTGALQLAFEQLKKKLAAEGLFEPDNKKDIPYIPSSIGIVTSPTGAAIQDILNILNRRFPGIPVQINPVSVQGDTAAIEIAEAIRQFNQLKSVDVMIIGRGGGSLEDLWAFNEEPVARAIFASEIPIISAVGHEIDFTISDLVADLRAPTPSAAAELVVPLKEDLEDRLEATKERLLELVQRKFNTLAERFGYVKKRLRSPETVIQTYLLKLDELSLRLNQVMDSKRVSSRNKLEHLAQRLTFQSPENRIETHKQFLNELRYRLETATNRIVTQKKNRFTELTHVLDSVSPLSTMNRGYSVLTKPTGKLITSIKQVKKDSRLNIRVSDGTIEALTDKVYPNENESKS